MRYLKKTDWGDYWVEEKRMEPRCLIARSFEVAAQMGLCLQEPAEFLVPIAQTSPNEPLIKKSTE